jgi:hypothetical protein
MFNMIKVPGGFETSIFYKVLPEILAVATHDYFKHGDFDRRSLVHGLTHAWGQQMGGAPIPNFMKWPIERIANYSFFTGRQIVPFYKEGLGPLDATRGTGATARAWSEVTGGSALHAQYALNNYILPGGFGRFWTTTSDFAVNMGTTLAGMDLVPSPTMPLVEELPVIGVALSSKYGSGARSDFFDVVHANIKLKRKINALEKVDPGAALEFAMEYEKSLAESPELNRMRREIKKIRDEKKRVFLSRMGFFEKRQALSRLDEMENHVLRNLPAIRRRGDFPSAFTI